MTKKLEVEFIVDSPNELRPVQLGTSFVLEDGPLASEEVVAELFDRQQEIVQQLFDEQQEESN